MPALPTVTPVIAVVGSTAAGKTGLSIDLAEALGGDIVNTDAMQLYRGMDIGTAKVPEAERRGVTHHLLDTLSVRDTATVHDFQGWARAIIGDLRGRGHTPVLVGGSALYTRAVIDRFEFPGTDAAVRASLEAQAEELGAEVLFQRLVELDPVAASNMERANTRRVVRALEVIELTGQPWSATLPVLEYLDAATLQIGVDIDRPTLDARIEQRVQQMFDDGFVAEVERLLDEGLEEGVTARRAIGYREVVAHLRGELTAAEAQQRTMFATRRFARKQDGWFRKDPRIRWIRFDDPDRLETTLGWVRELQTNVSDGAGLQR